jgi:hypothetical protein
VIPPEVLLDRFLKSDDRSQADRAIYKGKQDLQALEPSLSSLLAGIQDTVNADLRQRGNTFGMERVHSFHFDYVDATRPNALAFEQEGYAFICVTMPLVRVLWRMCDCLSKSANVVEVFRVDATSPEREAILAVLFTTQFAFIVGHEFAHHDRGHFRRQSSETELWEEVQGADGYGSLEEQAREVDADGWAVYLTLSHLVLGQRREMTRHLLRLQTAPDDSVDRIFLSSFIIAVAMVLCVFPPSRFDEQTLYRLAHPPQAARMNAIMHRVKVWCQQNRPALQTWLTLERFQGLMNAAREATDELTATRDWRKQTEFFHTQAGSEYFKRLHEAVVSLIADEGLASEERHEKVVAPKEFAGLSRITGREKLLSVKQ